jgi:hypothetical protein
MKQVVSLRPPRNRRPWELKEKLILVQFEFDGGNISCLAIKPMSLYDLFKDVEARDLSDILLPFEDR